MSKQVFSRKILPSIAALLAITTILSQNYAFAESSEDSDILNESYTPSAVVRAEGDIDEAFNDTVFIGDSITTLLRDYVYEQRETDWDYLGDAQFLARSGFSSRSAHNPINETSLHPFYDEKKIYVEDAVKLYSPSKIYVMLGINDIVMLEVDESALKLEQLLDKILAKTPNLEVTVQSITPMLETHQKEMLNNASVTKYNKLLKAMCKRKGYIYLDAGAVFKDENGALREDYCKDPETMGLHINELACEAWVTFLRENAAVTAGKKVGLPAVQQK